jgi:hypothetical protein
MLREQPELAGPVVFDPAMSRLVTALAADGPQALKAIRAAGGAAARERARWPARTPWTRPAAGHSGPGLWNFLTRDQRTDRRRSGRMHQ